MILRKLLRQEFKISYSRINAFLFCPYKYRLAYIDGLYWPHTADISFGNTLHSTLEKFHAQKNNDYNFLLQCYEDSWRNDGFTTALESFEYYERGKEILKNYFETFSKSDTEVLFCEKRFNSNIGKYKFIGIIDRIDKYPDGTYEVMDYKTHAQIWTQEKVDEDLQLSFYAYACKNALGFNPDKICVYFLSANKKIYTHRTPQQLSQAIDLALEVARKIDAEEFTPNLAQCAYCAFNVKCKHSTCPAGQE
ncbi:MAG: PD-(D/E)XK nuclease family protein [Elusimicrobiota bacterium]|jgi:RecB family exonuclease|nr:PD-(D/E)XK nuclease family protein [Elusimicrobiota bacterium]